MIDIHCHILPAVDDGAGQIEDTLIMARLAASGGVRTIVATPHYPLLGSQQSGKLIAALRQRAALVDRVLKQSGIPVTVLPGAEVLCTPALPEILKEGRRVTLAGSRYLLTEFYFNEPLPVIDDTLSSIAERGFVPVIAHPERYDAVQRLPGVIERWWEQGYIIQVNQGSVLGSLGRRAHRTAEFILRNKLAHVAASDGHDPTERSPQLHLVRDWLESYVSPDYAALLLHENPGRIISDLPLLPR